MSETAQDAATMTAPAAASAWTPETHVPEGPVERKWAKYREEMKILSSSNRKQVFASPRR